MQIAIFMLVFLQTVMLVIFGQFALKVEDISEPLGTLFVSAALGFFLVAVRRFRKMEI